MPRDEASSARQRSSINIDHPCIVASGTPIPRWKRIVGYGLVGFGVLSVIDFFSPIPIPTTFLGAFFTGGIAIVAGAWLLTGGGWLVYLKRWAATRWQRRWPGAPG